MTTIFPKEFKCSVCGNASEHYVIGSTNAFGSPDLDLRPPEMQRSTIVHQVQRCPECGYCNNSLDAKTSVDKDYLSSNEYKALFADIPEDSLAASFIRQGRINEKDKKFGIAMFAYLRAAWCCDDNRNLEGAKQCRLLALKVFNENYNAMVSTLDEETAVCLQVDMLRRAECFEDAIAAAQKELPKAAQDIIKSILNFEIAKCNEKDAGLYRVSEAVLQ